MGKGKEEGEGQEGEGREEYDITMIYENFLLHPEL